MKKLLLPMLIATALTGCASFPDNYKHVPVAPDIKAELQDQWSSTPAVTKVLSNAGVSVRKFNDVPVALRDKALHLSLEDGGSLTVSELVTALRAQGVRVSSSLKDTATAELSASFDGDLGSLLDLLAAEHNIAYEYRNDVLFLTESGRYVVALPQHEAFLKQVAEAVKEMGGTAVRSDVRAGRLYYSAKPDVAAYLEEYINTIGKNSAMVNLQVAVITVRLTRDVNLGLDWSKLQLGAGTRDLAPGRTSLSSSLSGGSTTTTTTSSSGSSSGSSSSSDSSTGTASATAIKLGSAVGFLGGSGAAATFVSNNFSLAAAINALSTYGQARTEQNVIMGTLSGLGVKIGSGNEIPYVKSIGSTTASGGSTSGSSQTDIVKSGLKLEVTPNFESDDLSVVTTMKVDMSSLVGFRELSAGTNLGTMSQPEMQKLEFENVGRLQVGETLVVGGITYDQLNNSYTNLPGMEQYNTGSKSEKTNRYAVYIVIRPTVTLFELPPKPVKQVKEQAVEIKPVLAGEVIEEQEAAPVVKKTLAPAKRWAPRPASKQAPAQAVVPKQPVTNALPVPSEQELATQAAAATSAARHLLEKSEALAAAKPKASEQDLARARSQAQAAAIRASEARERARAAQEGGQ